MSILVLLALFLSFISYSSAQYCLCKTGSSSPDPYKKVLDYACGNGANCGPIQQNGPCYQANNIQAICSYAANSYYQNRKYLGATCDFGGVAAPSSSLPSDLPSGCTYPTSPSPASPGAIPTPGDTTTIPGGGVNNGSNPINFSPGQGPTAGINDLSGTDDPTSLLQVSSYIVSLSLTLFSGLLISGS